MKKSDIACLPEVRGQPESRANMSQEMTISPLQEMRMLHPSTFYIRPGGELLFRLFSIWGDLPAFQFGLMLHLNFQPVAQKSFRQF